MHHAINVVNRMIKTTARARRKPPVEPDDTRTRILDVAERLFAERGIETVSVRSILAEAGANVALAHYYFGSREGLVEELIRTRVAPFVERLLGELDAVDARADATLEDVLRTYFLAAARWLEEQARFGRILAQLQTSPSARIRAIGREAMRKVLVRLGEATLRRLPGIDPKEFFLRFYLVVGGPTFLTSMWDHVRLSARRHFGADTVLAPEWIAEQLVAFSAAGLRAAPVPGRTEDAP